MVLRYIMPSPIPSEPPQPDAKAFRHLMAVLLFLLPVSAPPQAKPSEYDVKATYLSNFGKFIHLAGSRTVPQHLTPQNPTFDICILGHDPIGHQLDDITAKESIDNRTVRVVRIADAYAARACEVVFISLDEGDGIRADLAALGNADVLTVSDAPGFLKNGGMIQFLTQRNRVRFAVNLDAVGRTHLILSSELLRVACSVTGKTAKDQP